MPITASSRSKRYINVMESLVAAEFEVQLARLAPAVRPRLDRTDVEAWALNQLPARYATSKRWIPVVSARVREKESARITEAVQRGIMTVYQNSQPAAEAGIPEVDFPWEQGF